MNAIGERLEAVVREAEARLRAISDERASEPLSVGGWSAKQMVGHLIDSASTNHQRFVRLQQAVDSTFPGYDQNFWVDVQGYQERKWTDLVCLWSCYNLHLAHVILRIDASALTNRCRQGEQVLTLEWYVTDYLRHLEGHLEQLSGQAVK